LPDLVGDRDDLDQLIRRVDPDRWLTTRFIADPSARADVIVLYAYDHELARAAVVGSTDLMAEIRLTWWREVLGQAFGAGPVRRHPTAEALADVVRRRSLQQALLEAMIDARIEALDHPTMNGEAAGRWADGVGGSAAVLAAAMLDPAAEAEAARPAGQAWGLGWLARSKRAAPDVVRPLLRAALEEAKASVRRLSVAALPAALPATLARADLAGRSPGPMARRLSLVLASATGRV